MFRTFLIGVAGFVAAAVATYLILVVGILTVWDMTGVHDQDGGGAMAIGLVIGPFFALIGGIAGAIALPLWAARRRRDAPPQSGEEKARDIRRLMAVAGAVGGGFVGNFVADAGFWLAGPIQFDSYWKAWAVSWLPSIAALIGAMAGGWIVWRMTGTR